MDDTDETVYKSMSDLVSDYYKRLDKNRLAAKEHYDRFFQGIDDDIAELERISNLI